MHAGEIYGSRSLLSLLRAVDRLSTRHPARPIQVINYDALPAAEWRRIREAGLEQFMTKPDASAQGMLTAVGLP